MSRNAHPTIPVVDVDQVFPTLVDRGPGSSSAPPTSLDQTGRVRSVLRDVLGLRTRAEDPKAFVEALSSSFQLTHVEGHVESRYVPRGFAASDLGYISGGQASLYQRASVFAREIGTIVDGLRPLRPDADTDDIEAYRMLVRDAVTGAVAELGATGGPRVEVVDSYFTVLTGATAPSGAGADGVGGQLGAFRERFGLTDSNVNTPTEEAVRARFGTLVDMVDDLHRAWTNEKPRFAGDSGRGFLGTELVWLSRLMEAAADQVDELEAVLDSVMIGMAERRTIRLLDSSLTLDGLLSWLRRFLTFDGRRIIADTGRDGIVSTLTPMLLKLLDTFKRAIADDLEPWRPNRGQPRARPRASAARRSRQAFPWSTCRWAAATSRPV